MSRLSLRLSESLHKRARDLAKEESISINQLITTALAEKIAVLDAEKHIQERAKRASRARFLEAMATVPDVEPPEYDRLPENL